MNKIVQIISITPNDRYHVVGRLATLMVDSLEIGNRLVIVFSDKFLKTSTIQEIKQTKSGVTVTTLNSVYELIYLEKEE